MCFTLKGEFLGSPPFFILEKNHLFNLIYKNKTMKLKSHKEYSYDEIFDKYLEKRDRRFISYAFIKRNNLEFDKLIQLFETDFETMFLYIYNIQRELDNQSICKNFHMIKSNEDDITLDDFFDDDEEYDF